MQIAIVPSYGSAAARPHWNATLAQQVDFQARAQSLSDSQSQALQQLHPEGKAHFWGAASSQDANVARLQEGDFVLFTGKSMVRGIGEVGVRFQNQAFADSMWTPDPDRGSWACQMVCVSRTERNGKNHDHDGVKPHHRAARERSLSTLSEMGASALVQYDDLYSEWRSSQHAREGATPCPV